MKGLIHCQDIFYRLEPLSQFYPLYLLPICNKPLIEYQLEALYALGIREVRLVVYENAYALEEYLGNGQRLGLEISYIPGHALDNLSCILDKNQGFLQDAAGLILIDGLVLPEVQEVFLPQSGEDLVALSQREGFEHNCFYLSAKALKVLYKGETTCWDLAWRFPEKPWVKLWSIQNLQDYFLLNQNLFKTAQGKLSFPTYYENTEMGLGKQVHIAPSAQIGSGVLLGDRVFVDEDARLENSILGPEVVIGARSTISNSIILCRTQIGADLEIHGKILVGEMLIDPKRKLSMKVDFTWFRPGKTTQKLHWLESFIALAMLAIQAPLYWLLKPFITAEEQVDLSLALNSSDFSLLPRQKLCQRLFFGLSLHKYHLWKQVLRGHLHCVGHPTSLAESEQQAFLPSDFSNDRPGVFSYTEYLGSPSQDQVLDELYYRIMRTILLDVEVFLGTLKKNWKSAVNPATPCIQREDF